MVGLPALLEACGGAQPTAAPSGGSGATSSAGAAAKAQPASASAGAGVSGGGSFGGVKLPAYIPFQGPKPDLPGGETIDPGYFGFPKDLVKTVTTPPGKGDQATMMVITTLQPPPPMSQNALWQELNKQLGLQFNLNIVASADYQARVSTTISGGDLPDMLYFNQNSSALSVQHLPAFLKAQCADLTTFLSGDAIKAFPNLATFPPGSWQAAIYNKAIYAVPVPRPRYVTFAIMRKDFFDAAGVSTEPKSADDFKKMLQAVTKAQEGRWGMATAGGTGLNLTFFLAMFGAPNNWQVDSSGKFTKDYESDAMKAAVAFQRDLWAAGVFHPNSLTYTAVASDFDIVAGKFAMYNSSYGAFPLAWDRSVGLNPMPRWTLMPPFPATGSGKATYYLGPSSFGVTAFKKASADRIKELLGIFNLIGAPFGSQEHLLVNYGVKDMDFTFDDKGNPVLNTKGKADANIPLRYVTENAPVLYDPNNPQAYATLVQGQEKALDPVGIPDPTLGLFSDTDSAKGGVLSRKVLDGVADIVAHGRPISDLDQLIKDWRSGGGDQIRSEYEKAYADLNSK